MKQKRMMKRTIAAVLSCTMLPVMPASIGYAEETEKDFAYYESLSDYEVYTEYCENFVPDVSVAETLPYSVYLPDYELFVFSLGAATDYPCQFEVFCQEEQLELVKNSPELLGFSTDTDCIEFEKLNESKIVNGVEYEKYIISFRFDKSTIEATIPFTTTGMYVSTIPDLYRVRLALQNSDFFQQYCLPESTIVKQGDLPVFGDMNNDNVVNASDASWVLRYAAIMGGPYALVRKQLGISTQNLYVSDVTGDYSVDATDASWILMYAAATGVGYQGSLDEFFNEKRTW